MVPDIIQQAASDSEAEADDSKNTEAGSADRHVIGKSIFSSNFHH